MQDSPRNLHQGSGLHKRDMELQSARQAHAESTRQFESVLDSLSGFFYRCDLLPPWQMSFLSKGVESLTGYRPSELQGQNGWSGLILAEDRAAVESAVNKAISERRNFDVAYRITRKTGEVRWVSERGHAVFDQEGVPLFLEGVIADISGRSEADELQRTMLERWRRTLDAIPQMVWTVAADGSDEFFNAQWLHFTGVRISSLEEMSQADLIHVEDRSRAVELWKERFATGEPYDDQYRLKHLSGDYRWILSRGRSEKDPDGKPIRWYGTCTDIHDEVISREALQASEALNRSMIEASPDCISLLDLGGRVRFLNRAALEVFGLRRSIDPVGRSWTEAFPPSLRTMAMAAVTQAAAGETGHFTATRPQADGQRWWDIVVAPIRGDDAQTNGLIAIARDITHQKTAEDRIRWAANHDPLTKLPNRALFRRTADRFLAEALESGGSATALMMDLDDLKRTNDTLGHDAGDALLTEFATRLKRAVREDDLVARLGGDEFAVLLQGVSEEQDIQLAVQALFESLKVPYEFEGKFLNMSTSIGASTFPRDGQTRTQLLKHADVALYVAKLSGKGVLRVYKPEMRADAQKNLSMLEVARDAIQHGRIVANYQPKVDLRSGRLDGFEALLRWRHPDKGLQTPETIASAFGDEMLASAISDRMIEIVIADMQRWTDSDLSFGHVAINAAAAEFKDSRFAENLLERLHRADLPTSCMQLEVTETVFLGRGAECVEEALRALAAEGIRIALDDFGTGYASLSHLNKFPVHVIKIDRSFIEKLEVSAHHATIVRTIIKLGRSLGIKIVAEGIETPSQADFLRKHRCQAGQGFLFGKAVPASAVPSLVATWIETEVSS